MAKHELTGYELVVQFFAGESNLKPVDIHQVQTPGGLPNFIDNLENDRCDPIIEKISVKKTGETMHEALVVFPDYQLKSILRELKKHSPKEIVQEYGQDLAEEDAAALLDFLKKAQAKKSTATAVALDMNYKTALLSTKEMLEHLMAIAEEMDDEMRFAVSLADTIKAQSKDHTIADLLLGDRGLLGRYMAMRKTIADAIKQTKSALEKAE